MAPPRCSARWESCFSRAPSGSERLPLPRPLYTMKSDQTSNPGIDEKESAMGIASEFKEFAMKGNVVDLAVGVIIGAAFGKIVSSLVGDVIMPPLGKIIGDVNFSDMA